MKRIVLKKGSKDMIRLIYLLKFRERQRFEKNIRDRQKLIKYTSLNKFRLFIWRKKKKMKKIKGNPFDISINSSLLSPIHLLAPTQIFPYLSCSPSAYHRYPLSSSSSSSSTCFDCLIFPYLAFKSLSCLMMKNPKKNTKIS